MSGERQRAWRKANPDKVREQNRRRVPQVLSPEERQAQNEKARLRLRRWRQANPDKVKAYRIKDQKTRNREKHRSPHSGLTRQEKAELLLRQGGICAICKSDLSSTPASQCHGDHDHKTGQVRGVLCRACNLGLGFFKDDKTVLQQAINYLAAKELF